MNVLLQHVRFQPHGSRLMTSSAAFWLFSARILVFAMALAEMVAWGYLGSLLGEGAVRWIAAAFTGTIIFVTVWMVDLSLITLDRAWRHHAREILCQKVARFNFVDLFTFAVRIMLLVGSLTITAPYLAQLMFHNDIDRLIDEDATEVVNAGRKQLTEKFDFEIARRAQEIGLKRAQYELEVAGRGPSGRYGSGPASDAMLNDAKKLEAERDAIVRQKTIALDQFERLARDWRANRDELAATYNIATPQVSILENRKALDELRSRPEFQSTELAVQAFLGFIFVSLLLLKLFEPHSVRLYLSDVLQQEYGRYIAGTFDAMLPATERSTNERYVISPQRLHDFLVNVWVPARRLEAEQAEAHARTAAAIQNLELLEQMKDRINIELANAVTEVQKVCTTVDETSKNMGELRSAINTVGGDLSYFQEELVALEAKNLPVTEGDKLGLDQKSHLDYEMKRLEYRSHLQRKISDADRALQELKNALPVETDRFNRAATALKQVEARLQDKESELISTQDRIRNIRDQLLTSAGDRAQSLLKRAVAGV